MIEFADMFGGDRGDGLAHRDIEGGIRPLARQPAEFQTDLVDGFTDEQRAQDEHDDAVGDVLDIEALRGQKRAVRNHRDQNQ